MKITEKTMSTALISNNLDLLKYIQIKLAKIFDIDSDIVEKIGSIKYVLLCDSTDYATTIMYARFFAGGVYKMNPNEILWVTPSGFTQSLDSNNSYSITHFSCSTYEYGVKKGCIAEKTIWYDGGIFKHDILPERCNNNVYIDLLYKHDWGYRPKQLKKTYNYLKAKLDLDFNCDFKKGSIQISSKDYYEFFLALPDLPLLSIPLNAELILPTGLTTQQVENLKLKNYKKIKTKNLNIYSKQQIRNQLLTDKDINM